MLINHWAGVPFLFRAYASDDQDLKEKKKAVFYINMHDCMVGYLFITFLIRKFSKNLVTNQFNGYGDNSSDFFFF